MGTLNQSLTEIKLEERRGLLELVARRLVNKGYPDIFTHVDTASTEVEPHRP